MRDGTYIDTLASALLMHNLNLFIYLLLLDFPVGMWAQQPNNDQIPLYEGLKEYAGMLGQFHDGISSCRAASQKVAEIDAVSPLHERGGVVDTHTLTHTHTYIYIYKEKIKNESFQNQFRSCVIYIYIYVHK